MIRLVSALRCNTIVRVVLSWKKIYRLILVTNYLRIKMVQLFVLPALRNKSEVTSKVCQTSYACVFPNSCFCSKHVYELYSGESFKFRPQIVLICFSLLFSWKFMTVRICTYMLITPFYKKAFRGSFYIICNLIPAGK